jgi:hypothetical protein
MTIHDSLELDMTLLRDEIIPQLNATFTSHELIARFKERRPDDYTDFLKQYTTGDPHQKVNAQIGTFLSKRTVELGIRKGKRTRDSNVHGNMSENQEWHKT